MDGFVKWYHEFPFEGMSVITVDILLLDLSALVRIYQELSQLKKYKFGEN